jgi:Flp pilus assembly pilin Flp
MRSVFWKIFSGLHSLTLQEEGQDLVEYGLVALLIAVAAVSALGTFATAILTMYTNINAAF